jgi:hypothetical protein
MAIPAAPTDLRPLVTESSTSESTNVEVVLGDLGAGTVRIPDYQRDADQWGDVTKSLFIESVINNLTIPAFFFEVLVDGGIEINEVVDGQLLAVTKKRRNLNRPVECLSSPRPVRSRIPGQR